MIHGRYYGSNVETGSSANAVKLNQWNHLAWCREGTGSNQTRMFANGKVVATYTDNQDYSSAPYGPFVGGYDAGGSQYDVNGNIADLRVVSGTALYTAEFTPPTAPLTAVTNTQLLVQSTDAGIIDKGQSAQDLTLFGNSKSSTTQTKFLTSSMYFDGNGDYLKWTNDAAIDLGIGGEPFTIEWWQWWPSIVDSASLGPQTGGGFGGWNGTNGHQLTLFTYSSATTLFYQWWNGSGRTDYSFSHGGALTASTWQHFATVFDGTNLSTYVDGTRIAHRTSGNTFGTVTDRHAVLGGNASYGGFSEIYYSDVRITKGLARYSGTSFTVPSEALQG